MNYADTLDKALHWLRELELDKALDLLFKLLQQHPADLQLIKRIYLLEVKRPHSAGYQRICAHIFSTRSNSTEFHQIMIDCYSDFTRLKNHQPELDYLQLTNLFVHLNRSHLIQQAESYLEQIKRQYPEEPQTAETLKTACEYYIEKKQFIKARKELKYLIAYYAETDAGRWGLSQFNTIAAQILT